MPVVVVDDDDDDGGCGPTRLVPFSTCDAEPDDVCDVGRVQVVVRFS